MWLKHMLKQMTACLTWQLSNSSYEGIHLWAGHRYSSCAIFLKLSKCPCMFLCAHILYFVFLAASLPFSLFFLVGRRAGKSRCLALTVERHCVCRCVCILDKQVGKGGVAVVVEECFPQNNQLLEWERERKREFSWVQFGVKSLYCASFTLQHTPSIPHTHPHNQQQSVLSLLIL